MTVYLASPNTQQQAEHVCDMPVLFSYALYSNWMDRYQQSFKRLLIDSGAFSAMNSGKVIDVHEYSEWSKRWSGHADAVAGLDSIEGDWRQSLKNYEVCGFPTIHDTDPPGLLDDLLDISRERGMWIGIGICPPRHGKKAWVRSVCDRIPGEFHIHGWALRAYWKIRRIDSVDSTNWWRDAMSVRKSLPWLTYGEALEIVVKRYQREHRTLESDSVSRQRDLWEMED